MTVQPPNLPFCSFAFPPVCTFHEDLQSLEAYWSFSLPSPQERNRQCRGRSCFLYHFLLDITQRIKECSSRRSMDLCYEYGNHWSTLHI
jgi:hypothetical protein